MQTELTLSQLIDRLNTGEFQEGTRFISSSGLRAVYSYGTLSWVTQGGYLSTVVPVTEETLQEKWKVANQQWE